MRGLSVKQPYASLIMANRKTVELRSWAFPLPARTRIGICSSKRPDSEAYKRLGDLGLEYPYGVLLGSVRVVGCERAYDIHQERAFKLPDVHASLWAWILQDAWALPEPRPVKGQLGLFHLPPGIVAGLSNL